MRRWPVRSRQGPHVTSYDMTHFFREVREEAADFFEDFGEALFGYRPNRRAPREIRIGGVVTTVRPAVLFAERIDTALKLLFGVSICFSAYTATFVGFVKLSDLLDVLIGSVGGRVGMCIIGISYTLTALWKFLNIKDAKVETSSTKDQQQTTVHTEQEDD